MTVKDLLEHSPVGPSSLDRAIHCPGSVTATEGMEDVSSEYANEGNFAHYITELARNESKDAVEYLNRTSEDTPWRKDNGEPFICDREMVTAVQDYIDFIDQFGEGDAFVEQRVTYDAWMDNGWGTSDHILLQPELKRCVIIDFKYGKGIQVNAKHNTQLKGYALGVFQDWGELYDIDEFILCISQPRISGHRDQWTISTEKLLKWAEDVLEPAGERIYEDEPVFKAGGWCQWCKIKQVCSERAAMVRDSVMVGITDLDDEVVEEVPSNPIIMDETALGECSMQLEQIKKWCVDVEEAITKRVMAGKEIISGYNDEDEAEYWKQVEGRSNRAWRSEEEAKAALKRARLKKSEMVTEKLISPTQAEAVLGAKHKIFLPEKDENDEFIPNTGLIVKPQGKPVLVRGSDPRDPYKVASSEMEDLDNEDDDDSDTSWLD